MSKAGAFIPSVPNHTIRTAAVRCIGDAQYSPSMYELMKHCRHSLYQSAVAARVQRWVGDLTGTGCQREVSSAPMDSRHPWLLHLLDNQLTNARLAVVVSLRAAVASVVVLRAAVSATEAIAVAVAAVAAAPAAADVAAAGVVGFVHRLFVPWCNG